MGVPGGERAGLRRVSRHPATRNPRGGNPLVNLHVLRRPAIYRGLLGLLTATGSYYALLFTLAQYLQGGLGRSALFSGLVLLPWVASFGLAGTALISAASAYLATHSGTAVDGNAE